MQTVTEKILIYDALEKSYAQSTEKAHRKKFAQFFTPYPLAELMSKWLLGNKKLQTVLDPAFGLGVFSRALLSHKNDLDIKGFEIDEHIYNKANDFFKSHQNIKLHLKDYIYNDWDSKYDGIICNPPYFKFHDYDNKAILKEIESRLGHKLNGFTNLYSLFLLKSICQLKPKGRLAYIVPSEFLNSDYGKIVKSLLLKSKTLRHIIVIDFEENIFEDVLTTACVILCSNDNQDQKVQFGKIKNLNDLKETEDSIRLYPIYNSIEKVYPTEALNPELKWRAYYKEQNSAKYKNLVPFAHFGKVVRGIATGANDYFTFSASKAKNYKIPDKYLLPCICKSMDVKKSFFTKTDFEKLKSNDRPAFLLNAIDRNNEHVNLYIKKGEEDSIHKRYLTACRNPWFILEKRPPAPIWVSVFNRKGLKFIRNEANISNLTTFHCIYPNQNTLFSDINIDLLFAYLLTETAKQIFEDNSREYGNGLQKFEPNDINKGKMLDLTLIDKKTENQILELYYAYRETELNGNPDLSLIEQINEVFVCRIF